MYYHQIQENKWIWKQSFLHLQELREKYRNDSKTLELFPVLFLQRGEKLKFSFFNYKK